ncbi:tryptophanyl-tRNA synthetase [Aaosphaeria arxii CBS 175.79]|uniref:Tryptophan--tRNA ligase, mitochondrial n=1 Tax=Aaosphaeria arxii CBS 175.79 TaxID=1450172 RepID=A0A6A5X7E0_9PLEO|nr:tryptophanyl-tRNA synthetase [Aaosphaeria arxii CBS 175.79]KAF2008839.1 tryptophanyl-tRNA synthetase [Aaosphaeria arxii CBS 175.79]
MLARGTTRPLRGLTSTRKCINACRTYASSTSEHESAPQPSAEQSAAKSRPIKQELFGPSWRTKQPRKQKQPYNKPDEEGDAEKGRVIFSGIQPTGIPHLGNYLGALREWVRIQNTASEQDKLLFSVVDMHAITVKQDSADLRRYRREMMASLLAVGLDPLKSLVFTQGKVHQHAELMWILSCTASMGYLSRMTQWKSKMGLGTDASPFESTADPKSREALKLGLFSYPVLQAADILLYGTTHVPVGEDQAQHLEFTRQLALGFNAAYGRTILTPPETILAPAKRVMSLTDPTKKMSKSDENPNSRILITDSKSDIEMKIMKKALTDSIEGVTYDRQARPGVSNLIDIMYYMDESVAASPEELAKDMANVSMRALKEKVAETVNRTLEPIRTRYNLIMKDEQRRPFLQDHNEVAASAAKSIAKKRLRNINSVIGMGTLQSEPNRKVKPKGGYITMKKLTLEPSGV